MHTASRGTVKKPRKRRKRRKEPSPIGSDGEDYSQWRNKRVPWYEDGRYRMMHPDLPDPLFNF